MDKFSDFIKEVRNNEKVRHVLNEYGGQIRKISIVAAMIIIGLAVYSVGSGAEPEDDISDNGGEDAARTVETSIFVDIGGAVKTPMLAELPEGSRVEDAINAAGGLTDDADISSINRAEFLEDGTKIYIPVISSTSVSEDGSVLSETSADGKVNINTADSDTLQTLSGVGPVTAEKIIQYRETSGRFKSAEDLKNVSGIGDKTYEKLKDYITI